MKKAILRTLAYADIFDYPLTFKQLHRFLINPQPISQTSLKKFLKPQRYYYLKGRKKIIRLCRRREQWSRTKLILARRVGSWLRIIPMIKMVAVTGGLAMANSDCDDDLDLLIVANRDRLWLTRLLAVLLIELVAKRRRPDDLPTGSQICNKICLNMFLDEAHLRVPKKEQDLYCAHEVCQLLPLWDRDDIYQKFINQNQWVKKYLANWKP